MNGKIILADCMEVMAAYPNKHFDLAIVDPPYGMGLNEQPFVSKSKNFNKGEHKHSSLDSGWSCGITLGNAPTQEYFDELKRVAKNFICFGMQYFVQYLEPHACVIVWDKINGASRFSDAEIAYTTFDTAVRCLKLHNPTTNRIHLTEKPVKLYEFLLKGYAKEGDKILDTHAGSMNSVIAFEKNGFKDYVAIEINLGYYADGINSVKQFLAKPTLF